MTNVKRKIVSSLAGKWPHYRSLLSLAGFDGAGRKKERKESGIETEGEGDKEGKVNQLAV